MVIGAALGTQHNTEAHEARAFLRRRHASASATDWWPVWSTSPQVEVVCCSTPATGLRRGSPRRCGSRPPRSRRCRWTRPSGAAPVSPAPPPRGSRSGPRSRRRSAVRSSRTVPSPAVTGRIAAVPSEVGQVGLAQPLDAGEEPRAAGRRAEPLEAGGHRVGVGGDDRTYQQLLTQEEHNLWRGACGTGGGAVVNGQVAVPAGGQLKVPSPRGSSAG